MKLLWHLVMLLHLCPCLQLCLENVPVRKNLSLQLHAHHQFMEEDSDGWDPLISMHGIHSASNEMNTSKVMHTLQRHIHIVIQYIKLVSPT